MSKKDIEHNKKSVFLEHENSKVEKSKKILDVKIYLLYILLVSLFLLLVFSL